MQWGMGPGLVADRVEGALPSPRPVDRGRYRRTVAVASNRTGRGAAQPGEGASGRRASDPIPRGSGTDPERRFEGMVNPFIGRLVETARRILGSDDLAWEAVQEALLCLWQREDLPPNLRSWLIRTVVHRCLHIRRTLQRRRLHETMACRGRPESNDHDNPLQNVLDDESRCELREALARMAGNHREVILLHTWEGLDYEAIAARLGIPIGTVRSRLNRAREALRSSLARGREGPP